MPLFKPEEIFQFAIRIETNGENFYRKMAEKISDQNTKTLFNSLADEEVTHRKTFEQMVARVEKYEPFENFPGEYFEYLRAYADNIIFSDQALEQKIKKINNEKEAINFALDNEIASILYYQDIKALVSSSEHKSIEQIVNEERRHYLRLTKIKKNM